MAVFTVPEESQICILFDSRLYSCKVRYCTHQQKRKRLSCAEYRVRLRGQITGLLFAGEGPDCSVPKGRLVFDGRQQLFISVLGVRSHAIRQRKVV